MYKIKLSLYIKFKDIDKAIIRNIKTSELITSGPTVLKKNNTYVFLFPLIGEYNFGWLLYFYHVSVTKTKK